jgi:hypothetical protein
MLDVMMRMVFLKSMVLPRPVREVAVLEHLEQDVEHVGVRLLDLVEQHHRVGIALHALGELPALLVPDVAGGRADELADRVLLHVLGHVEADERALGAEEERGQRARDLGLAHAGGAEEQERAHRAVRVLEAGPRAADGARHRGDRVLLRDDALVQLLFHAQELGRLSSLTAAMGMPVHLETTSSMSPLVTSWLPEPPMSQCSRTMCRFSRWATSSSRKNGRALGGSARSTTTRILRENSGRLLQGGGVAQLHAAARLVQEVDGLVGQEAVGDVAAGLVDGGLQGLVR